VLATYFRYDNPAAGPSDVFAVLDSDGLASAQTFPPATPPSTSPVLTTNVGVAENGITPRAARRIGPQANLAWDHSINRAYLVSTTEEDQQGSGETDIVLLTSDNNGTNWTTPKRVNDDPPPTLVMGVPVPTEIRSQFFPHVAVDQSTGQVIVAWYDPRNDDGGTDATPNSETEVFAAISTDGGDNFPNMVVSDGFSRTIDLETSHGDYLGVDIRGGIAHVAWVDNSNNTGDNPNLGTPATPGICG